MPFKIHRRGHQQRAERLEARFSPAFTGDSSQPTVTVLPNSPVPASHPHPSKPSDPLPIQSLPLPDPVVPTTTPVAVPSPISSSPIPIVVPPVVSTTSSSSVVIPTVTSSSSSSSSSIVSITPIIVPTNSPTSVLSTPTTFRNLPETTYTPMTTSSAVPAATPSASSGMKTGSIVGIAAASIAGVVILGVAGMWVLKRYFQSRDEDDDGHPTFQRHSWMRNSVALPDDAPSPLVQGPSINPRPPTMIERKQTQRLANVSPRGFAQNQGGYYQDPNGFPQESGMGMAYSNYQDSPYGVPPMPSYSPGQHVGPSQNSPQPFFSPIGSPPLASPGVASFDESTPPVQHASYDGAMGAAAYFSRPNTNKPYPDLPGAHDPMPNPHDSNGNNGYTTLDRSSVTPYQAQQYAEISRQLEPVLQPVAEGAAPAAVHEPSPFEDPAAAPAPEGQVQELPPPPSLAHTRIDSTPPTLPPMRTMSPVGAVAAQPSIAQLANAFPAAPKSPKNPAFPPPVAIPSSPKSPSFKQAPPLSPAPSAQGQMVSVPESVHVVRETPVQFGFNDPVAVPTEAQAAVQNPKRMSVASRKSVAKSGRPETVYDEDDAYGGF